MKIFIFSLNKRELQPDWKYSVSSHRVVWARQNSQLIRVRLHSQSIIVGRTGGAGAAELA